jgi:hypothetical protein
MNRPLTIRPVVRIRPFRTFRPGLAIPGSLLALTFGLTASGCSPPAVEPATVNGTVNGIQLVAGDSVYANQTLPGSSSSQTTIAIVNTGGVCAEMAKNQQSKNLDMLLLFLGNGGDAGTTAVTGPGTYTIGNVNSASFRVSDASCQPVPASSSDATSGTVTVTAYSTQTMTGTFDLMFGTDHVTGAFSAENCPGLGNSPANPTCI